MSFNFCIEIEMKMISKFQNSWLQIPADDYEGHMSDENVRQQQALNEIFKNVLAEYSPESLCVLGCTTGNGFEHINTDVTKRDVGVDINKEYLEILHNRFGTQIPGMKLICDDLNELDLPAASFDLIHAALLFEYVDVEKTLNKISRWLKKNGILSVVLQLPSDQTSPVSETPYQSLKLLSPILNLVNPDMFSSSANKAGLKEVKGFEYDLKTGKKFFVAYFSA